MPDAGLYEVDGHAVQLAEVSECLALITVDGEAVGHIACVKTSTNHSTRFTGRLMNADAGAVDTFTSENWVQLIRAMVAHTSASDMEQQADFD